MVLGGAYLMFNSAFNDVLYVISSIANFFLVQTIGGIALVVWLVLPVICFLLYKLIFGKMG